MLATSLSLALSIISCASNLQTSLILRHAMIVTSDGYGSGVYVGNGYFLTTYHVVLQDSGKLSSDIAVISAFGKTEDVLVVWHEGDVALLKTRLILKISPVQFGMPDLIQETYFVQPFWGHKQGLQFFIERGIVSRIIGDRFNVDHNVSGGISGSGVWSKDGELLGVMDAELIYSSDDQRQAFGESITIPDTVQKIIGGVP
jgi:V8-like Glu-specific endopeptidase